MAIILPLLALAGCASSTEATKPTLPDRHLQEAAYSSPATAALVFDPPATAGQPPLALARADREPTAFIGFPSLSAEFYDIHTDDNQTYYGNGGFGRGGSGGWNGGGNSGYFQRRTVSDRVGVIYR
jgi:hypothetical protein